jgi:uncharacterized protein YjeT (DUF2065 family)
MALAWSDFGAALALVLIIEGVMPFLAPARLRQTMETIAQMTDGALRGVGVGSMVAGLILLYLIR